MVPKDDKAGVMIGAFQSREFGLKEVNKYREGKFYSDADAAKAEIKQAKKTLTSTPIIQEFECSKANGGYWTYQKMVCKLDNCVDVLKVLQGDRYDFMFLFYHSCGHD